MHVYLIGFIDQLRLSSIEFNLQLMANSPNQKIIMLAIHHIQIIIIYCMNRDQKVKQQLQIQTYLEQKKVYHYLEDMLNSLIINKPKNPIDFLISKLEEKEQKRIFIVGPPGFKLQELALSIADSENAESSKLNTFSVGDQINKQFGKKQVFAHSIELALNNFQYVNDDTVIGIVKTELEKYKNEKKNYIIEGFPKTRAQGVFLRNMNIFPTTFLIINLSQQRIEACCLQKLNNSEQLNHLDIKEKKRLAKLHQIQYSLNIKKVKELYAGNYYEIDATNYKNIESQELLEEADRILKFKIKSKTPKKAFSIILTGAPCSGRTSLGRNICSKYGFIFVSTADLISHEINIKSPDGIKLKQKFERGELVDQAILLKLLSARLKQKDCLLQGYLLDGFPKTPTQLEYLKDLKVHPTLFISINIPADVSFDRKSKSHIGKTREQELQEFTTRTNRWKQFSTYLDTNYNNQIFKINGTLSMKNMFENVCFQLENI